VEKEAKKVENYQQGWTQAETEAEPGAAKDQKAEERTLAIQKVLLYRKGKLWEPRGTVQKILESEHNTKIARYMGQDKTIELIRWNFWWPKMDHRIIDFVRSCPDCQENNTSRHQPYGLASPLELPYAPWQLVAMDFMMELPMSEEYDQLWVVIDRFTKMAHFIPLCKMTAANLAVIYTREVWKRHGLPTDIVSD